MTTLHDMNVEEPGGTKPEHRLNPPAFGASYDKARQSYGVATALLLAWALVGIELDKSPLSSVKVTLKSPQAAPYVFIAAVLYFAFRFTMEWYQADESRRAVQASRVDYVVAHGLGASSILLFLGQKLLQVQIADKFSWRWSLLLVASWSMSFAMGFPGYSRFWRSYTAASVGAIVAVLVFYGGEWPLLTYAAMSASAAAGLYMGRYIGAVFRLTG